MLQPKIRNWIFEAIRLDLDAPQELKDRLLRPNDPHVENLIVGLTNKIVEADRVCSRRGVHLKTKTLQDTTYDMVKFALRSFHEEAQRRYESDMDRLAREAEASKLKEFDDFLKGGTENEFAEAGVVTSEELDKEREII